MAKQRAAAAAGDSLQMAKTATTGRQHQQQTTDKRLVAVHHLQGAA